MGPATSRGPPFARVVALETCSLDRVTRSRSVASRRAALALLCAAAAASFIGARFPVDLALHHTGTIAGALLLVWVDRRWELSGASYAAVVAFLAAHGLGARYVYSLVPYDEWSAALTGHRISDVFGFHRNHYDRLVHLLFGLLLGVPAFELVRRRSALGRVSCVLLVLSFVLAASALYELFEWGLAVTLAPDSAERYNGQQGDMWDAQRDMTLALLGAVLTTLVCAARDRR